jgi:Putative beta-barrel porin 2
MTPALLAERRVRAFAATIGIALLATPALAQYANNEPPSSARLRLGPLVVKPSVALTDFGIDTNVFNETHDPKRDVTATIEPKIETWLRAGPARLNTRSRTGLVYYQQYHGERSLNSDHEAKLEFLFGRVRPFVDASILNSRQRPGYEIDTRAQRQETGVTAGGRLRVAGDTWLDVAAHRSRVNFDADAVFVGTQLHEVLNRDVERASATLRYPVTPYTTIIMLADMQRDRFELSPDRDSKSLRVLPGVEFDARALLSGRAYAGYRRFDPLDTGMPGYRGVNASIDLVYTLLRSTKFAVRADRDVNYSMERTQPYYVLTGVNGSLTQAIVRPWDLRAAWGRQQLDYRNADALGSSSGRVDRVRNYGLGLGYRLNGDMRVGFDVNYYRRESDNEGRQYETLQAGTSVTYGF